MLRWLKFSKYLRDHQWEPVVFTAENADYPEIDTSNMKDIPAGITVLKKKIWEPYSAYKRFIGAGKKATINTGFLSESKKPGLLEKISVWIRGNLFIPDAKKYWIKPASEFLIRYLRENPVDAIVSTGPPHTTHMIALRVKEKTGIPWIADFRDPWTNIDFYDKLMLSKWADKKHHHLEKKVIKKADLLTVVSWNWGKEFDELGASRVEVIAIGFDPEDFNFPDIPDDNKFAITHIGSFNKDRNPEKFWQSLTSLCNEHANFREDLKIRLIGKVDHAVIQNIHSAGLSGQLEKLDYMPHAEVLKEIVKSPVLLLPINQTPNLKGIVPGKVFEYLAARRPVFVIGPEDGDTARIVKETGGGIVCEFDDSEKMKE